MLLVTLAGDPRMHLERLAESFEVTDEYLRLLRRKAEAGGLGAVLLSRMGGQSKVTPQKRQQLWAWFAEGLSPTEAYRRQARRGRLSRATISRERAFWRAEQVADEMAATVAAAILAGAEVKDEPSGRWQQENALKHGVQRWGLNQLDGRKVVHYPPDTIIPNPARRRIDRALRLARAEEGAGPLRAGPADRR